jgi:predicted nucleotidyltransferase
MMATMRDIQPLLQELKARLQELYGERLKGLYLFGSYARGDAEEDSDVDVAVLLDDYEYASDVISETGALVSELSLKYNCLLSLIPIRAGAWREKEDSLLINIRREGVAVL